MARSTEVLYLTSGIGVAWITWIVIWFAAARWSARKVEIHAQSAQGKYRLLQTIGAVLLAAGNFGFGRLIPLTPTIAAIAFAMVVGGLAYTIWARVHLGRNWSVDVSLKAGHKIIRTGPYGITRHPIYTGLLLAVVGTTIMRGTVLGVVGLGFVVAAIHTKLSQEEELLSRHFPDDYPSYRRDVHKLIPFVW